MRVMINIFDGPAKGRYTLLEQGKLSVGRDGTAFSIPEDTFLSRKHFEVELVDGKCLVRDLNSNNGTYVKGQLIVEAEVRDAEEICAGGSSFQIALELSDTTETSAPTPEAATAALGNLTPAQQSLWRVIHFVPPTLYAILDAAIGEQVRDFLALSGLPNQSLYEGQRGEELARFAPYLVTVHPKSDALRKLIENGWGKNWGIFFSSPLSFVETRRHFRRFLLAKSPNRKTSYFRFYDPRVLRGFLPQWTPEETQRFFGPITQFLLAAENPAHLLRFTHTEGALKKIDIDLEKQAAPNGVPGCYNKGNATALQPQSNL